jgi:hypothetical protein
MLVSVRIATPFSGAQALGDIEAFRRSFLILAPWLRKLRSFLACCLLRTSRALRIEIADRLLHERPALSNAAIDLFRQNLETLVTKADHLSLLLLRNRRCHGQLVSSVQRDCLRYHPHVVFETVEPVAHIVTMLAQQSFDCWGGCKKLLKGGFHEHALTDARSVGRHVEPTADTVAQPNSYFATYRGFAPARGSNVNTIGLDIQLGKLLHLVTFPNAS